jgi:hypothetical protein
MMRSLLVLSLLLGVAGARPVSAQSAPTEGADSATERARSHFKLGVDLYRERNFRAALIEFKRAYKAAPHYKLLYNLGQASLELQEDSSAIEYFSTYLAEGKDDMAPERRQEVEDTIVRLKARLATVTVTSNQPGAEIYVDDSLAGTSPLLEPLKLSVGRRTILARKHGFTAVERVVDVAAGDHLEVVLEFKDKPVQPELAKLDLRPSAASQAPEDSSLSAAAWMGITTAALGVGGVSMSILTALAQKDYDNEKQDKTTAKQLQDLRESAKTKALVTDIVWGATLVSATITTVLLLSDGAERAPQEDLGAVHVNWGPTSLSVRGRF